MAKSLRPANFNEEMCYNANKLWAGRGGPGGGGPHAMAQMAQWLIRP